MPGGFLLFEYKCLDGHITEKRMPPGTPYDHEPSILCSKCKKTAYIIFAFVEHERKKLHV